MPTVEEALIDYICSMNKGIEVQQDQHLANDLNLDSLDVIEMMMHMEETFDIIVDDVDEFRSAETFGQLAEMIRDKYGIK